MIEHEEHERIKFDRDTLDILRGADDVRERLLVELTTGVPAISSLAYATKIRVKEDFKIAEKVRRKQLEKSNPDYSVHDLRDIVGLRLVTLYRLDALRIIPAFLDRVQKSPNNTTALFVKDEIEEVIIYGTNAAGDAQTLTSRLLAMFESRKLKCKPDVRDTITNYSSIHMVVWCRGRYNDGYRRIPVEVQVRTALEDVWGEIEHGLKYKKRAFTSDSREATSLESSEAHLNVMKTLVDGVAQYADQIKIQFDQVDLQRLRALPSRLGEDGIEHLNEIQGLPDRIREAVASSIKAAQDAISQGRQQSGGRERIVALSRALTELNSVYEMVSRVPGLLEKQVADLKFVLGMERALIMFEIGNDRDEGNLLLDAERIYARLEVLNPDALLVSFRRAKVLEALSDRSASIGKLEEVARRLFENDSLLPPGHWLRVSVPRLLGTFIWEQGFNTLHDAPNSADHRETHQAAREFFLKAFQITRPILDIASDEDPKKAVNNLLWYALDYLDCGGNAEALEFSSATAEQWLEQLGAGSPEEITDVRHANTAARACHFLKQDEPARKLARRTIELLSAAGINEENASVHDGDMIRASKAVLAGDEKIRW